MAKKSGKATDFAEIAQRFESQIDFSKIKTKEEFEIAIRKNVSGNSSAENILKYLDELYEQGGIKEKVEANQVEIEDLKGEALRFEAGREKVSRLRDESRTARDTRAITPQNFRAWKARMGRMDLRGVDTRRGRGRRGASVKRLSREIVLSKGDRRLVNVRPWIDVKRRVKLYRSSKTGQFVPSPWKKRR